jgi:hypothetical protein
VSTYTKGPWNCETYDGGSFDIAGNATDHYYVICSRSRHSTRGDEQHANARLIAAAPELLEALQALVNSPRSDSGLLIVDDEDMTAAASAIAKATQP